MQPGENDNWALEEFGNVDLGDKRRRTRVSKICGRLSERPESSITPACGDWAETKAA